MWAPAVMPNKALVHQAGVFAVCQRSAADVPGRRGVDRARKGYLDNGGLVMPFGHPVSLELSITV